MVKVLIVEDIDNIDADMYRAMDWALAAIKKIQKEARNDTNNNNNNRFNNNRNATNSSHRSF